MEAVFSCDVCWGGGGIEPVVGHVGQGVQSVPGGTALVRNISLLKAMEYRVQEVELAGLG